MSANDKQLLIKSFEEELAAVDAEVEIMERRREALESTIENLRELISLNGGSAPAKQERPLFSRNAFADLGVVEATVKILGIVGVAQTNREVVDALLLGGKKSESKSFSNTVRITLLKESEKEKPRVRWVNHKWELPEWSEK